MIWPVDGNTVTANCIMYLFISILCTFSANMYSAIDFLIFVQFIYIILPLQLLLNIAITLHHKRIKAQGCCSSCLEVIHFECLLRTSDAPLWWFCSKRFLKFKTTNFKPLFSSILTLKVCCRSIHPEYPKWFIFHFSVLSLWSFEFEWMALLSHVLTIELSDRLINVWNPRYKDLFVGLYHQPLSQQCTLKRKRRQ